MAVTCTESQKDRNDKKRAKGTSIVEKYSK